MLALIPQHSEEFRTLEARLTLLKVVLREIHDRRKKGLQKPSRAMRTGRTWDAGLYPQPADFATLSSLWSPANQAWTES